MAGFCANAYVKTFGMAIEIYEETSQYGLMKNVELWEIEPDRYGNHYVVITREKSRGCNPKVTFIRKIK